MSSSIAPRRRSAAFIAAVLLAFGSGFFLSGFRWTRFVEYDLPLLTGSSSVKHPAVCPAACAPDPYLQPGMILWGPTPSDTRWVAFPPSAGVLPVLRTKEITKAGGTAAWANMTEALELAVPAYTKAIKAKDEETVGWARGKLALFVGSSHDRANVAQFCVAVGGKTESWGAHIAAVCYIDWLDLTLASWFLVGMVDDDEYGWFVSGEQRPLTFERRIPEIMLPAMKEGGLENMKPDLIVFASLFWDESFIWRHGQQVGHYTTDETDGAHGFFYEEIKWHRARIQEFILYMREMFGEDVPMMFRTRQHRARNRWGGVLKIAQIDQSCRAITKEMGVKLFTWGSKLEGYLNYDDKDQHFNFGPTTYLFGDMFMFYLRQALVPGCWSCQQGLDSGFEL